MPTYLAEIDVLFLNINLQIAAPTSVTSEL